MPTNNSNVKVEGHSARHTDRLIPIQMQSAKVIDPIRSRTASLPVNATTAASSPSVQPPPPSSTSSSVAPNEDSNLRIAQACDRCRSKKTRCDGKRPQCSQCAIVGFECKISDKLQRKSFPRGYTETLEEKVRELENENRRLLAICQFNKLQSQKNDTIDNSTTQEEVYSIRSNSASSTAIETDSNITTCLDTNCNNDTHNHLHMKPVSTKPPQNIISFEQNEAPGLSAVKALKSMANHEQSTQLATLVALAIPRSTDEILFIPQLLSKIRQNFGFTSKHCLYTCLLYTSRCV